MALFSSSGNYLLLLKRKSKAQTACVIFILKKIPVAIILFDQIVDFYHPFVYRFNNKNLLNIYSSFFECHFMFINHVFTPTYELNNKFPLYLITTWHMIWSFLYSKKPLHIINVRGTWMSKKIYHEIYIILG